MIEFSQYDLEERDVSQNENRDFFLKNSFRLDTLYNKTETCWNHGLIAGNKVEDFYKNHFSVFTDNFSFSEILPFWYDFVVHEKVKIPAAQYDFLKSHVDLRVLSACIKVKRLLVPFYGKMFGFQYLQSVLFDSFLTDTFFIVWCTSCPLSLLEIYKHYRKREKFIMLSESYVDAEIKLVLRECFNQKLDEDEALRKIFEALKNIGENWDVDKKIGRIGATAMQSPNTVIKRAMESDRSIWSPSGVSEELRLIRDENNNCKYYFDEHKNVKEISFQNLASETSGKINLDAYFVLANTPVSDEETLSFDECMSELWILRGE